MKVIIFGTGDCYHKYKVWFDKKDVLALLDNDKNKQGKLLDGIKIMSPESGLLLDYDEIYILSVHEREIRQQLVDLGVCESKIRHYSNLRSYVSDRKKVEIKFYGNCNEIADILFLSYDLNFNGASLALYNAVLLMKKNGYSVTVASMNDGELLFELINQGIPVIIDKNMHIARFAEIEWIQKYNVLFCNTLNFYQLLCERDLTKKIIWWLHEPDFFYNSIDIAILERIPKKNLYVYAAGLIAAKAFQIHRPDIRVDLLMYGLIDRAGNGLCQRRHSKLKFAVIGNLQNYKGQDTFIKAIVSMEKIYRECAEFYIVGGNGKSAYAEMLFEMAKDYKEIIFLNSMAQSEIHNFLNQVDVLVCPSRQDTMPTVVAEAMMHWRPCIISDQIGTAAFIQNFKDGIVFECDNTNQLAEIMCNCIAGNYNLREIGKNARLSFERLFSIQTFDDHLSRIFDEVK